MDFSRLSLILTSIRDIIGLRKPVKDARNDGANRVRHHSGPAGSRLRGRVEVMAAEDVRPNALRVDLQSHY